MLKAYELGSSALKGIREEHGLTLDRVDNVMDEVQQVSSSSIKTN